MEKIICPECKKSGLKSIVRVGMSMSTAASCRPWYDEDGNYHHHDTNRTDTEMTCSNGHTFAHRDDPRECPTCGQWWKKKEGGDA